MAGEISRQIGREIPYTNLPVDDYAAVVTKFGMPESIAQVFARWDISTEKGDMFDDSHTLSKLIGRPTTTLAAEVTKVLASAAKK